MLSMFMRFSLQTVTHTGAMGGMVRSLHTPDRVHVTDHIHHQLGPNGHHPAPFIILNNRLCVHVLSSLWGVQFRYDVSWRLLTSWPLSATLAESTPDSTEQGLVYLIQLNYVFLWISHGVSAKVRSAYAVAVGVGRSHVEADMCMRKVLSWTTDAHESSVNSLIMFQGLNVRIHGQNTSEKSLFSVGSLSH
jgi:hypothetical protein